KFQSRGGNNMPLRSEIFQFVFGRPQKHVVSKKIIPGLFIKYPDIDPVPWVCTGIAITNPQFRQVLEISEYFFVNDVKILLIDWQVKIIPMNSISRCFIFHDKFIFRRTTCKFAGTNY